LILRPREPSDIFFGLADFGHRRTVDTVYRYSGMHRDDGMLIMNGPGVRQGGTVVGASIYDLAPTVLHAMGLPIPSDMDGQLREDLYVDGYLAAFPPQFMQPVIQDEGTAGIDYTAEGEKEILERLEGLGYLG